MKRNLSSSALNLQAMTVAMAAMELKIPFHLSIPQSFRAKDHGAGAEGISFLLLLFQNHTGLKFMFHLLNFSRTFHPIVRWMEEEGGEWMNTGGCSAAIHFIEVREIFLTSSECSSFLLNASFQF
jgi:hypothetical protein